MLNTAIEKDDVFYELEMIMSLYSMKESDLIAVYFAAEKLSQLKGVTISEIDPESLSLYLGISIEECLNKMRGLLNYIEFDCISEMIELAWQEDRDES